MKNNFLYILFIIVSTNSFSQILGYTDLGVLFSQENYNGTARYNGMGGAFGALGGDISSLYHNPAGGAVFSSSEVSGSLSYRDSNTETNYYNTPNLENNTSSFRAPQFGLVLINYSPYSSSNWSKFAFGFNYSNLNDFENSFIAKGSNTIRYARYDLHPYDEFQEPYGIGIEQGFTNTTSGRSDVFNFSLSSAYKNLFYVGASLNFHDLEFSQDTNLTEENGDGIGNTLFADYSQYLYVKSSGVSLGVGIILKPFRNLRLGATYKSPVWHLEINEYSNSIDYDYDNSYDGFKERGYLDLYSDTEGYYSSTYSNNPQALNYLYSMNTPEKWTVCAAITLGQHGLISADLYQQNYKLINFTESYDFIEENEETKNTLANTRGIKAGVELRFNQISIRSGAFVEENPYISQEGFQMRRGVSAGIGFKFKRVKLDLAYQYSDNESSYAIYDETEPIESISLKNKATRISSTLSFNL